jgi:hypothetical protein
MEQHHDRTIARPENPDSASRSVNTAQSPPLDWQNELAATARIPRLVHPDSLARNPSMTEQPPSAGALHVAETFVDTRERWHKLARRIDALCAQRVSAETERCATVADSYAHSAADSAQENTTENLASAAQADEEGRRFVRERWRQGQHYFHGKRHCAVEIAKAIRAPSERPAPEGPQQSGDIVRWGVLRLLSGDLASNEEKVDAELDLDDFQFWFQENPKHTGFKQILINLSGEQWGKLKELPLVEERSRHSPPSALASTGEQPDCGEEPRCEGGVPLGTMGATCPKCGATDNDPCGYLFSAGSPTDVADLSSTPLFPAAVADYTERARELYAAHIKSGCVVAPDFIEHIAVALSAVAVERDAAAIRAFGQRVWSDSEETAYQAGVSDTRERLLEPDVREAVKAALEQGCPHWITGVGPGGSGLGGMADAALTKIAEMLK